MRKDEETIELFYMNLGYLEKHYPYKAKVTKNAGWITIEFGSLVTVKARGYVAALHKLDDFLVSLE